MIRRFCFPITHCIFIYFFNTQTHTHFPFSFLDMNRLILLWLGKHTNGNLFSRLVILGISCVSVSQFSLLEFWLDHSCFLLYNRIGWWMSDNLEPRDIFTLGTFFVIGNNAVKNYLHSSCLRDVRRCKIILIQHCLGDAVELYQPANIMPGHLLPKYGNIPLFSTWFVFYYFTGRMSIQVFAGGLHAADLFSFSFSGGWFMVFHITSALSLRLNILSRNGTSS